MVQRAAGVQDMSGELNEISRAIGRMEEAIAQGNKSRDRLSDKIDELVKSVHAVAVKAEQVSADVEELKPIVEDYRDTRARAKGVIACFTLAAALVGGVAGKAIEVYGFIKH